MKKLIIIAIISIFYISNILAQENNMSRVPLIGEKAPSFTAQSTKGTINFPEDFGTKWKILFSHPADFTPICTSEIMELALMDKEFENINTKLVVISTDELVLHTSWVESMDKLLSNDCEGSCKIDFPLVDDSKFNITSKYGMLSPFIDPRRTVRGVFIIGPENKIEAIFFYPKNIGRNLDEIKRTVIALQTSRKYSILTPVNWKPGEEVLLPYPYLYYDSTQKEQYGIHDISWYMMFKKLNKDN